MRALVDTSAWLTYWDQRERDHRAIKRQLDDLARRRAVLFVTDYIFDETVTLVLARAGHAVAVRAGKWLLSAANVHLVRVNREQWQAAWLMFLQYEDKEFSFTDCTSFVVMRELHLADAFTLNRHFEQMGFRMWPK